METIIRLTEDDISEIVKSVLLEATQNLSVDDFESDMRRMGFEKEKKKSGVVYRIPTEGGNSGVLVHYKHGNEEGIKADTLRNVKKYLETIGWFDNPENLKLFPFDKWQFPRSKSKIDTTEDDIRKANKEYKEAEVMPVFPMQNSICVLKIPNMVNLCKSVNDRRPLLSKWYNEFSYRKEKPCLIFDNYELFQTEIYPINPDGTLDYENVIIENRNYGKHII